MAAVPQIGRATRVERPVASGAAAAGDLYERYSAQIYGYCLHQLGSREEAEDAVQTTFMNAFRGLQRGIVPELESAWLFKIAHNVCLSRRRSSWRRGKVEAPNNFEVLQEVIPSPEHEGGDELIRLQEVLEGMPENQRRAILLREWQGLTYREVADELGVSQAAVETLIFRARRALAAGLEQDTDSWKKRLRRGADAGSAVACIKALLSGGGAATVKVAATALAVATAGVAAISAPVHAKHLDAHHAHATRPAAKAHTTSRQTSTRAFSGTARQPFAARTSSGKAAAAQRHLIRPVAMPASKPEETTSAPPSTGTPPPAETAPAAPAPPAPPASESAPTPPPAQSAAAPAAAAAAAGDNQKGKTDKSDRRPQATLSPPTDTTAASPPADSQPTPQPQATPPAREDKSDKQDKRQEIQDNPTRQQDNGKPGKPDKSNGNNSYGDGH